MKPVHDGNGRCPQDGQDDADAVAIGPAAAAAAALSSSDALISTSLLTRHNTSLPAYKQTIQNHIGQPCT